MARRESPAHPPNPPRQLGEGGRYRRGNRAEAGTRAGTRVVPDSRPVAIVLGPLGGPALVCGPMNVTPITCLSYLL